MPIGGAMFLSVLKKIKARLLHTAVAAAIVLLAVFGGALFVRAATAPPTSWLVYVPANSPTLAFLTMNEAFDAFFARETATHPANYTTRCMAYAPKDEYYSVLYNTRTAKWVDGVIYRDCSPWPEAGGSGYDRWFGMMEMISCVPSSTDPRCFVPYSSAVAKTAGAPGAHSVVSAGDVCCGNPINVGTGNKYQTEQDFEVPGSPWLSFTRYYNSQGSRAVGVVMGKRWRHSFDYQIEFQGGSGYALQRPDGSVRQFGGSAGTPQDEHGIFDYTLDSSGNIASYYLLDVDGTKEFYSPRGIITRIEMPSGGWMNFEYPAGSRMLSRVVDHNGRALQFTYDGYGRVATVATPAGAVYRYAYNNYGFITTRTAPDGGVRTYTYDEAGYSFNLYRGLLTRINDETGAVAGRYAYDAKERAISTEGGGGANKFVVTYGTSGTSFTTPSQAVRSFVFGSYLSVPKATAATTTCPSGDCAGLGAESSTYDTQGNQTSTTLADGTKVCRSFDTSRNLPVRIVEGLSSGADCGSAVASPPAGTRTTSIDWHYERTVPLRVAGPQLLMEYLYDAAGRVTRITRTATGGTGTGAEGFNAPAVGAPRAVSFTYDSLGRVLTADGPRTDVNDVYSYAYDAAGNLASVVSPTGKTTSFSNYDADGRPRQMTEPGGVSTALAYDARGRLTSSSRAGLTTSFTYYANGLLATQAQPDGTVLSYGYDAAGRLASVTDERGNKYQRSLNAAGSVLQASVLNGSGAVVTQLNQSFDSLERVLLMSGAHSVSPTAVLLKP